MKTILRRAALACFVFGMLSGCAANNKKDPLEPLNRGIYQFNDTLDKALIKPVATAYQELAPQPVQSGVSNFFGNLNDVLIGLNNLLQGKVEYAVADGGRVLINSSVGLFGLIDIASRAGMQKHNEDFGQTLGRWGVGNGPFLMLPLFGPSTLRDSAGLVVDSQADLLKRNISNVPLRNRAYALRIVNRRAELLDASRVLEQAALDPYQFLRDAYLQQRRSKVYDGNPPPDPDDHNSSEEDDYTEDWTSAPTTVAAPAPAPALHGAVDNQPSAQATKPLRLRLWLPGSGDQ